MGAIDDASTRALRANSEVAFCEIDRMIENQWIEFGAALVRNPEAQIDFAPVDDARAAEREEREEHRSAVKTITARMTAAAGAHS